MDPELFLSRDFSQGEVGDCFCRRGASVGCRISCHVSRQSWSEQHGYSFLFWGGNSSDDMAVLLGVCIIFASIVYVGKGSFVYAWLHDLHIQRLCSSGIKRKIRALHFCVVLYSVTAERSSVVLYAEQNEPSRPGILYLCLLDAVRAVGTM